MADKCPTQSKRTRNEFILVGISLFAAFLSIGQYFGALSVSETNIISAPPLSPITVILIGGTFYLVYLWWTNTKK